LLSVIELLFLSLTVEALQGKMYQNSLPSGVGRSLGAIPSGILKYDLFAFQHIELKVVRCRPCCCVVHFLLACAGVD